MKEVQLLQVQKKGPEPIFFLQALSPYPDQTMDAAWARSTGKTAKKSEGCLFINAM